MKKGELGPVCAGDAGLPIRGPWSLPGYRRSGTLGCTTSPMRPCRRLAVGLGNARPCPIWPARRRPTFLPATTTPGDGEAVPPETTKLGRQKP